MPHAVTSDATADTRTSYACAGGTDACADFLANAGGTDAGDARADACADFLANAVGTDACADSPANARADAGDAG